MLIRIPIEKGKEQSTHLIRMPVADCKKLAEQIVETFEKVNIFIEGNCEHDITFIRQSYWKLKR